MALKRVALLTAGGFAPCLSTAVGMLIERYTELEPEVEIIAYEHGYHGLLTGKYLQMMMPGLMPPVCSSMAVRPSVTPESS